MHYFEPVASLGVHPNGIHKVALIWSGETGQRRSDEPYRIFTFLDLRLRAENVTLINDFLLGSSAIIGYAMGTTRLSGAKSNVIT